MVIGLFCAKHIKHFTNRTFKTLQRPNKATSTYEVLEPFLTDLLFYAPTIITNPSPSSVPSSDER